MEHINWIHNIPFFSIFLAMICGIITALAKDGKVAFKIHTVMVFVVCIMSGLLLFRVVKNQETFYYMMGHFPAPWGNELRAGPLEALMAVTFSLVMLLTVSGGLDFIMKDVVAEKQPLYFIMLNALFGAMLALIYTNDIFTAYVFIEINTIASCALIMAKGTPESMVGTTHYLVISLLGSGLFLLGVSILYSITGHLLFPQMQEAIVGIFKTGEYATPLMVVTGFMFIGIAIKSALFPFHSMLPGAYNAAIPTSSGILSGLVLKSYIILGIKLIYCVFSELVMHTLKITEVLFVFGLAGMVMGSVYAMRERKMKRMLAYSSVAQIGYIYMGIGMGTRVGMTAACFHILAHAITKTLLFLCCGSFVEDNGGKDKIYHMRGAALRNPLAGVGYTVGALSMVGIPLLAGFISKVYFATASVYSSGKMAAVLIVLGVSMVLNALYFLPSVIAIWSPVKGVEKKPFAKVSPMFAVSIVGFIILNFALGVYYRPITRIIQMSIGLLAQ
ncbi:complex I subunit 5 family protein [Anaerotignum sp. MB30-C6]|uniref:complex I subunit 5 family protein n=1 Tax=Anaerotignum sp. MB30-C6 TaxID=3070814 RepID=UPI0027DB55A6|nr:proton-conducting transporter membrane subunit [Anaerotignum sp. MB30-C6]WMI80208.1 proton-conducting transporter membrane subunit [Anaerotignum sp. MB30-C6]